ncbi:probable disease resistance protein At1g59620 [Salvia miltiorrhiza]|uniref:probable disease resistance protein At1g59620 n=1 Tax=Salvia miltiorrhiza TaxID=226208 RepID=UPI0025AB9E07|nr:probable disease resistance protein At1g59620 [Salvia miltiorrhiza]
MAAEAAISSVVELLGNQLIQKVKSLQGVEGKVELLREELKRMQSFLKDANKKQFEDESVRNWISNIRELAQDAQDTIEIFLLNVESAKNGGLIKRCTTFPKRMHHLDKIGDEIESIQARLDAIDKSRERYGIKDLGEAAESASRWQIEMRRRLCPWQKNEHLVGVEDDLKKLLQESILHEKKGLCIAVLEGMGGIGKSTLAREIYNHPDVVAGPFERRGWVVVSSEFTPQETIKQLIFDLPGSDKQKVRELEETMKDNRYLLQKLQEMLYKQLEGKSYLIVLDDVWEKEHLESLITAFPHQQDKASRLLVTTRNKIITKYDQYVHKMSLLDPEKSWELLLKKAYIGCTVSKCPEEFESVGTQILEKCHGISFDEQIERQELIIVRASLEKMQNLVILHILGLFGCPTDIALAVPHLANLTKLKLYNPISKCPTVRMFPPNISHLTLMSSELVDDPMAELGKLPKLFFLKIEKQAYLGETMLVLCDGFPCLEALVLRDLDELESVFIEEGGMPKLKHLRIRECPNLKTRNLPQHINIFIE